MSKPMMPPPPEPAPVRIACRYDPPRLKVAAYAFAVALWCVPFVLAWFVVATLEVAFRRVANALDAIESWFCNHQPWRRIDLRRAWRLVWHRECPCPEWHAHIDSQRPER